MLINTTAYRAGSRGISGINEFDHHACQLSFILDKAAQLSECPRVLLSPLAMSNRDAGADTLEVFQGDPPSAVFSLHNNTLRDYVIDVLSKAALFFATLLEKSFRCFRIFGLKFGSKFGMPFPQPVDLSTRVNLPIGVGGDVNDTEINSKKLDRVTFWCFLNLTGLKEVEVAVPINQVGLPAEMAKHLQLPFSSDKRNLQPTVKRPDRNKLVSYLPREDTLIISDAPVPVENSLNMSVNLIGIRHLCQNPDHDLSSKVEATPKVIVKQMVQVILAKSLSIPCLFTDIVSSIVHTFQCFQQRLMLLSRRGQFDLCYQLHRCIIAYSSRLDKKGGSGGFLCHLKEAVSTARFL